MEFIEYVRKPFKIEALLITEENLEEVAQFIGVVQEKEDGTKYLHVGKKVSQNVYPGYYMTRYGQKIRFYNPKVFNEQFEKASDGSQEAG